MEWVFLALGLVVGAAVGAALVRQRARAETAALTAEIRTKTAAISALEPLRSENEALRLSMARADVERSAAADRIAWVDRAREELREAFAALASQALASNADQVLTRSREQLAALLDRARSDWGTQREELKGLVAPLEKTLVALDGQVRSLEEKREGAYRSIEQQIRTLGEAQVQLQATTTTLSQAMKSSTARGRWGELQLRRIVELAGMEDHVDFSEQAVTEEGRPDLVVHLPGNGIIPVDAKASAAAYLAALELDGDARRAKLAEHARAMRTQLKSLASKQYWAQFDRAPELVVMFVPIEPALSAAFEADPELLEFGLKEKVLFASPITLLALLRTAAFGWQEQRIAADARAIADEARRLCDLVANVAAPIGDIGKHLERSVDAYNKAVGSLEGRLLGAARRLSERTASDKEIPELSPLDRVPRLPLDASGGT